MRSLVLIAALVALTVGEGGCGCGGAQRVARPYPEPAVETVLDYLARQRQSARSFRAESVMDYWVGGDRVKGTVLLMGEKGARVRINALSPAGDSVAADLACDGSSFTLIDSSNNCQLQGPCSRDSIAKLLRVSLSPDDFMLLVVGQTPIIEHARASLAWDASHGREVLTLTSGDGQLTQTIALAGPAGRWDVVSSVLRDAQGRVLWNLDNKDFHTVTSEDGVAFRVPEKTRFKQPQESADLLVRWGERTVNLPLDPAKFVIDVPAGLRGC